MDLNPSSSSNDPIDGKNYFGKAAYQMDDPMGDIGFTFNDGTKIRSES